MRLIEHGADAESVDRQGSSSMSVVNLRDMNDSTIMRSEPMRLPVPKPEG